MVSLFKFMRQSCKIFAMSKSLSRSGERRRLMVVIYQALCVGTSIDEAIKDQFHQPLDQCSPFVKEIVEDIDANMEHYIRIINERLNGYTFQRLGYVEQSILLVALSEMAIHSADKAVIINEAVELSKTYCDEKAHKLVNGVLDHA